VRRLAVPVADHALSAGEFEGVILVKANDKEARPGSDVVAEHPASIRTGKTWQQVSRRSNDLDE
jgi:hypothetical protein